MKQAYTVRICKSLKNDTRIGPYHYSHYATQTLCGREINERWWIENSEGKGVTCKKCLALLVEGLSANVGVQPLP